MKIRRLAIPGALLLGIAALAWVVLSPETSDSPKQPNEYFHFQRAWPHHDIPAGAFANALEQARRLEPSLRSAGVSWEEAGPTNVGGRITAMAVDPNDNQRIWIGAADGGVLYSVDGGNSWTPQLDEFGGLSIGAMTAHPTLSDVLLVGTGEANGSGDSYDGIGLLKTTDGGESWAVIGLESSQRIGRIVYDPTNPDRIHVAVCGGLYSKSNDRGMYRSTDGGASWHQTLFVSDSTSAIDVAIHPTDGDILYAAFWERMRAPDSRIVAGPTSRIWKSTDGGDSWNLQTTGHPDEGSNCGRIGLAIAPSSPSTVYAIFADTPGYFDGVYKTTNSGSSWSRIDDGSDLRWVYSSFGWYFGNIRVSPTNPNVVFALGVDLYRSSDGGVNWSDRTGIQHVDMHALWIDPNNVSRIYSGNDGGFYVSTSGSSVWSKKYDLPITQFYAITVDPQLPYRIYGGTQDNSTPRTLTGALDDWDVLIGGDGFTVVIDPTDSDVIYGEYQYGGLMKSTNGGDSFNYVNSESWGDDRINWHMPYVMDPTDHLTLYLGTYRVHRTTNGGSSWTPISPDLTDGPGSGTLTFGTLTTLAVAPSAPATIYAGSDDGNVHVTTNGGSSWSEIDAGLPLRWITRVAVDPTDDAIAYVCLSGYKLDEFLPHVFRTTNHGASWQDISSDLPETPVNDLVVDPLDTNRLYVGTDVGVFLTNDLGGRWEKLGAGLPLSVVVDIELHNATRRLVAGTHGRSSFKLSLADAVDAPADIAGAEAARLRLAPPRPNPSQGETSFSFTLARGAEARLTLHDVRGRLVRELYARQAEAGATEVHWDGRDDAGRTVAPGVYFVRLVTGKETVTRKLTRIR